MTQLTCFKAYDVRGRIPDELDDDIAYRIGCAYAAVIQPRKVVVGYDIRLSSQDICTALVDGLRDSGVDVLDIGQCGTEEIYFATSDLGVDGGIVVTASHNPKDYNGMKFVRRESRPVSNDSGLLDIKALAEQNNFAAAPLRGCYKKIEARAAYIKHLLSYVNQDSLQPLKIVVNAGNGGAGAVIDALEPYVPFQFIKIHHQPDGNFPNGVPNPLLPENRQPTIEAIRANKADLGIAWDGDFDRCFLFDEQGRFIEGYYIVGLLAAAFLARDPHATIIHDPRLIWNTQDIVRQYGGKAVQSKTGHAFIKERMRKENAVYGGEMSAHHYFRDFAYCDSGMIPWLLVTGLICNSGQPLSRLIDERISKYPCSGEINTVVKDAAATLVRIREHFQAEAIEIELTDGISMSFPQWRFNVRMSNTEPVVRLNVESRGDEQLMQARTKEIVGLLAGR